MHKNTGHMKKQVSEVTEEWTEADSLKWGTGTSIRGDRGGQMNQG